MKTDYVSKVIDRHEEKRTALVSILHEIQDRYHFLPEEALKKIAFRLRMDLHEIYGIATFYKSFSLVPRGKHSITVCLGTACHVRGGSNILRELKRQLDVEAGQTTKDKKFSLNAVNCLGVCAIGPVILVDGKFYGEMNPSKTKRIIEKITSSEKIGGNHEKASISV